MRTRIEPGERVPLALGERERELIRQLWDVSPEILGRMRMALVRAGQAEFRLTLDELEELLGAAAFEASHAATKSAEREWRRLARKIAEILDRYTDESPQPLPPALGGLEGAGHAFPWLQDIFEELAGLGFHDIKEAQAFLDVKIAASNDAPQTALGGLSPNQMRALLDANWFSGTGLRLATDLSLDDLSGSRFLFNVRALLLTLRDEGPATATQAGNLSRAFVTRMIGQMRWEGDSPFERGSRSRALSETDVWPLHISRLVAVLAGLIVRRKGFRISARGKMLLRDDRAGELFAAIFDAYYGKLNLGYTDRLHEQPRLQRDIAFSFWIVLGMAGDWVSVRELSRRVWRPEMTTPSDVERPVWFDEAAWRVSAWLVRPLEGFGLLEVREAPGERPFAERVDVRKTPLFDKFLRFQVGRDAG